LGNREARREMAELKVGAITSLRRISPTLLLFRLMPEPGTRFTDYKPGQYIALRREDCRLTKAVRDADGRIHYVPDLDESGNPKLGAVTHSYSIASAPAETRENGHLEFYIVLEKTEEETQGRLSGALFRLNFPQDNKLIYVNRITGSFTLDQRTKDSRSVLMVGTGTGLAPFVSMIKQLHFDACRGVTDDIQYTLLHTNRTFEELAFHEELLAIESAQRFNFVYVPSVSRPTARDLADPNTGRGRANNLLRHIFDMPLKEEEYLEEARLSQADTSKARAELDKAVRPVLPRRIPRSELQKRLNPARTVILTCGNPSLMADISYIADRHRIRFEKEDW